MTVLPLLLLCASARAATFADVLPIFERHCLTCHRKGEIGKMPLTTYREARPWAKAIRDAVVARRMPPWFAAQASVHFANDPRLTADEIRTIEDWVRGGAAEGPRATASQPLPASASYDLTLTMPSAIKVPAREELDYQVVTLPLGLKEDRWVTGALIRPGVRSVVHHVVVYIKEPGKPFWQHGVTKADILALYAPGQPPMSLPEGMAKKIPAGSDLVLQLHYTPDGRAADDRTSISLKFAAAEPHSRVLTLQLATTNIRIPPGDRDYHVSAWGTMPGDALLLSLFPHMHLRGKAFEYSIVEPGGRVETLLRVAPYDFNWQLSYQLAVPRLLRKGTRLTATGWYDNSANNPRNPDPTAEVGYGEQSRDEMMVGFFDVAVPANVDKETFFVTR